MIEERNRIHEGGTPEPVDAGVLITLGGINFGLETIEIALDRWLNEHEVNRFTYDQDCVELLKSIKRRVWTLGNQVSRARTRFALKTNEGNNR